MRIILGASLILAGCGGAMAPTTGSTSKPGVPIALTAEQRSAVENGVKSSLKDPDSAKFGGLQAVKDEKGDVYVCGLVNAKNSFGGFTGAQPYQGMLVSKDAKTAYLVVAVGGSAMEQTITQSMCSDRGVDIKMLSPI